MPELQYLYDAFAVDNVRGNANLGDPNIEAQRTNQYNLSYNNQFADNMSFSVSAYFKDAYNQTGTIFVQVTPIPYYQNSVSEYGNSKGLEFTLRKMATDNWGFSLNYTLAQSEGTSSSPGSNYGRPEDPYTGKIMFPLAEYPMAWDRRHRINGIFDLFWRNGEGPTIAGMHILENTSINLSGFFQTGTPYTKTDNAGVVIGEINAERQPSIWSVDLRVSRRFMMRDLFGDAAGNTSFEIYFDVYNLLNRTAVRGVFACHS
jgi:outer membrane receptor protein involved in Fe transport